MRKYASIRYLASVDEHLVDMIKYVDVMIDNADVYYDYGWAAIQRDIPSGGFVYSADDIHFINKAAINCIDIIDIYKKLK